MRTIVFLTIFVTIAVTNLYFGVYQRGTVPRTKLPYKLNGIYTWLLLFGAASFSSLFLEFEFALKKERPYSVVALSLLESLGESLKRTGSVAALKWECILTAMTFI